MVAAEPEDRAPLLSAQLRARALLAVLLGGALMVFAHLPAVTVVTGTLALLMADGGLGLFLQRRRSPLPTPLLMMWSFNLGLTLMLLLIIYVRLQGLGVLVLAITGAVATGVWLAATWNLAHAQRRVLTWWTTLLSLTAVSLPVAWTLNLTAQDTASPRLIGALCLGLGGLMLRDLHRLPRA